MIVLIKKIYRSVLILKKESLQYCQGNSCGNYKKTYLIINEEFDEIQINIKHTKPYIKLQQENTQLKSVLKEIREKLKEHKYDLDYEPWSIYEIQGKILFDLLEIIDKGIGEER